MSTNPWLNNRHSEWYQFLQIGWPDWGIKTNYWHITGGSLELSALSDLKAQGTLLFEGEAAPNDHDMVRIFYWFTDDEGNKHQEPLATLFCECSEIEHNGELVSGTLKCYSVLQVLADKSHGRPYTVKKGTNALQKAVDLCKSLNLRVNNPAPGTFKLTKDHTFEEDASYLEMVNWLLETAGYQSVWPDAYGILQIAKYVEPSKRAPVFVFEDGEQSIMYPRVSVRNDYKAAPNVCRLYYETKDEALWAKTSNVDPESAASTVSRGREKTLRATISQLEAETQAGRLKELKELSKTKLIDASAEIEYVNLTHAWLPININDAIEVDYKTAGIKWNGAITNLKIKFEEAVPCQLTARRFIRTSVKTTTEGGVLYG